MPEIIFTNTKATKKRSLTFQLFTTGLLAAIVSSGCNLAGKLDSPKNAEEYAEEAQAQMNEEKCSDALTTIDKIDSAQYNNKIRQLKGWAQLCAGGATVGRVGKTLFNYSLASNNLTVVGALADNLIPMNSAKLTNLNAAITTFSGMTGSDDKEKELNQALANIVYAAGLIAQASTNAINVRRADVSPSSCVGTCSTTVGNCTNVNMSDSDANAVASALLAAQTAISGVSGLGAAQDLTSQLATLVTAGNGNANRCAIVNNMLSQ